MRAMSPGPSTSLDGGHPLPPPAPDDAPVLALHAVSKYYGTTPAVDGVDLEVRRGETVALLGPNGAGKSTTIAMLLGLLAPSRGTVTAFGTSPQSAIRASRIGAMLQEGKFVPGITVGEVVDFVRSLHPAPLSRGALLDLADLAAQERQRIDRLSGGQAQRLRFALAIAGNPDLLVLDEPTAAMDVEARRTFWEGMHAYAAEGHTVLFATHYLEEAEAFASRLVILARGRIVADGTVPDLREHFGKPHVALLRPDAATTGYEHLAGVQTVEYAARGVTLHTSDADATVRALAASALPWERLEVRGGDLEAMFLTLVHAEVAA